MRIRVRFAKVGKVRWTSHRDLARIWERAIRRVGLPVAYSQGFSPRPKVHFGLALSTGHESLAEYLDGRVTAVVGTHTHVQTADEQILKGGTAFITDLGMTGPTDSVLGVASEEVIERFLTGLPVRFRPGEGPVALCGALIEADPETGRACSIERVCLQ